MPSVAVIGAGLTGLAAARRLTQLGLSVVVYEAADRVGGVIYSERRDGYLAELGPSSIMASSRVTELANELGLESRRVVAPAAAAKRYVVRRGRLYPLPMSPTELLTSRLLSNTAKLAIFGEPFIDAVDSPFEESVASFARRRFNQEVLDYAVNPFVAGLYAGDPEQLSMRHAFPRLHALETSQGSLVKAAMQLAKARREAEGAGPSELPMSFQDGLRELPDTLARSLGDGVVRLESPVQFVRRDEGRWSVATKLGEPALYDAVVYTAPAHCIGDLDFEITGGERLSTLNSISYPAVAVVALGFPRNEVAHALDGFGFLVPEVERRYVLGVLFSSTLFPQRAPEGHVLLTAFVGGMRDPQFAELDEHTLFARVLDDLRSLLGVRGEPTFKAHCLWPRAIPQYVMGYGRFKELMDELERKNAGLVLAGTYRDGVSLGEAIASGESAAMRVSTLLAGGA